MKWMLDAQCTNPDLYDNTNPEPALLLCAGCPVTQECEQHANTEINVTDFINNYQRLRVDAEFSAAMTQIHDEHQRLLNITDVSGWDAIEARMRELRRIAREKRDNSLHVLVEDDDVVPVSGVKMAGKNREWDG